MRVLIAGASGMIGTALGVRLAERGDAVVRLVRRPPRTVDEQQWDPASGTLDPAVMRDVDALVNLSGASISRMPWTRSWRAQILRSRLDATTTLVAAMRAGAERGFVPAAFLSGSAVGFYGSRPGEVLTETSSAGTGFLADVVDQWEAAAYAAPAGVRVVTLRTGLVLGPAGALVPLRAIARAGLAGPIGTGRQLWPWISLDDEVSAIVHLLGSLLSGPVNLAGPAPATAGDIVRMLATRLRRPYWAPLPRLAVGALLGDAGRELLLADQRVVPQALAEDGFAFAHPTADAALAAAV